MDWFTFAADAARAVALVTAINVPIALLSIFLAGRKRSSRPRNLRRRGSASHNPQIGVSNGD